MPRGGPGPRRARSRPPRGLPPAPIEARAQRLGLRRRHGSLARGSLGPWAPPAADAPLSCSGWSPLPLGPRGSPPSRSRGDADPDASPWHARTRAGSCRLDSAISARCSSSRARSARSARAARPPHASLVLTRLFPGRLQLGSELGDLLAQLDQPIHGRPAHVRVREAATTSGAGVLRPFPGAPASCARSSPARPAATGVSSSRRYEPRAGSNRRRATSALTARAIDNGSGKPNSLPSSAGVASSSSPCSVYDRRLRRGTH